MLVPFTECDFPFALYRFGFGRSLGFFVDLILIESLMLCPMFLNEWIKQEAVQNDESLPFIVSSD